MTKEALPPDGENNYGRNSGFPAEYVIIAVDEHDPQNPDILHSERITRPYKPHENLLKDAQYVRRLRLNMERIFPNQEVFAGFLQDTIELLQSDLEVSRPNPSFSLRSFLAIQADFHSDPKAFSRHNN